MAPFRPVLIILAARMCGFLLSRLVTSSRARFLTIVLFLFLCLFLMLFLPAQVYGS